MRLTAFNVVPHLLDHGLIQPEQVIDEALEVLPRSGRNTCFLISAGERTLFAKQSAVLEPNSVAMIHREWQVLSTLSSLESPAIQNLAPTAHHFDPASSILVVAGFRGADDLSAHYRSPVASSFVEEFAQILFALHTALGNGRPSDSAPNCEPPWTFRRQTLAAVATRNHDATTHQALNQLTNTPGFLDALDELTTRWRSNALIHGDVKWANCLLAGEDFFLVDWELAGRGDNAWDLANLLYSVGLPDLHGGGLPQLWDALPRHAATILRGYLGGAASGAEVPGFVDRTLTYFGARLLQGLFEYGSAGDPSGSFLEAHRSGAESLLVHPSLRADLGQRAIAALSHGGH